MDDLKNSELFAELHADFEKTFHEAMQVILQDVQDTIFEIYQSVRNWLKGEEIYQGGDILPDPENPDCEEMPADMLVMKELQLYLQDKNWSVYFRVCCENEMAPQLCGKLFADILGGEARFLDSFIKNVLSIILKQINVLAYFEVG